jgi:hypothetical protein
VQDAGIGMAEISRGTFSAKDTIAAAIINLAALPGFAF